MNMEPNTLEELLTSIMSFKISPEEEKRIAEEQLEWAKRLESEYEECVRRGHDVLPRIPIAYHPIYRDVPDGYEERWEVLKRNPFATLASANVVVRGAGQVINNLLGREYVRMLGGTPRSDLTRRVDFYVRLGGEDEIFAEDDETISKRLSEGSPLQVLDENGFIELINRSIEANGGSDSGECYIPKPDFYGNYLYSDIPYEYDLAVRTDEEIMESVRKEHWMLQRMREDAFGAVTNLDAPASYKQKELLVQYGVEFDASITKGQASDLIDEVLIAEEVDCRKRFNDHLKTLPSEERLCAIERERIFLRKRMSKRLTRLRDEIKEKERKERQFYREVLKAAKDKWSQYVMSDKVKSVCKENRRIAKSDGVLHQWRDDFARMWNAILEDDVFDMSELERVGDWLLKHMRKTSDYRSMLCAIDVSKGDIVHKGAVQQCNRERLYSSAIDCLQTMGSVAYDAEG